MPIEEQGLLSRLQTWDDVRLREVEIGLCEAVVRQLALEVLGQTLGHRALHGNATQPAALAQDRQELERRI